MSETTLRWREASDGECRDLVRMFAQGAGWLFVESATESAIRESSAAAAEDFDVCRLWQLRVFDENFEFYARRLAFGAAAVAWRIRYLGDTPLWDMADWQAHSEQPTPIEPDQHVRLIGYATGRGDEFVAEAPQGPRGVQPAARYFPKHLHYPAPAWQAGQQAQLVLRRYDLSDGDLHRWVRIAAVPASQR